MKNNQIRILIVDDQEEVAEMLELFLRHAGYQTAIAFSATSAIELAKSGIFDLVISDIAMPEMNGYELIESLRVLSSYKSIPMIAVTGFSMRDDRERSRHAGFDVHLTKPVNPNTLLTYIKRLCHEPK